MTVRSSTLAVLSLILTSFAAMSAGCSPRDVLAPAPSDDVTGRVTGRLASGEEIGPVAGALVTLTVQPGSSETNIMSGLGRDISTTTNAAGDFILAGVRHATYQMRIVADGYQAADFTRKVNSNKGLEQFTLIRNDADTAGRAIGVLTVKTFTKYNNEPNYPCSANIVLWEGDSRTAAMKRFDSDDSGIVRIPLPVGRWELAACRPGGALHRYPETIHFLSTFIGGRAEREVSIVLLGEMRLPFAPGSAMRSDPVEREPGAPPPPPPGPSEPELLYGALDKAAPPPRPLPTPSPSVAPPPTLPTTSPSSVAAAPAAPAMQTASAAPTPSMKKPRRRARTPAQDKAMSQLAPELQRRNYADQAEPIDDPAVNEAFPGVTIVPVPKEKADSPPTPTSTDAPPTEANESPQAEYFDRDFLVAHPDGKTEILSGRGAVLKFVRQNLPCDDEVDGTRAVQAFIGLAQRKYPELTFGPTTTSPPEAHDDGHAVAGEASVASGGSGKLAVTLMFNDKWKLRGAAIRRSPKVDP